MGLLVLVAAACSRPKSLKPVFPPRPQTYALLLNGGGRPETNYQSHLQNIRSLAALLERDGVRPRDITIFSSDGSDPAADLATKELPTDPDFWLLPSGLSHLLRPPTTLVNSTVDGFTLRPAHKKDLQEWFEDEGARLHPGDTLLFYVTDHGQPNPDDWANNTITLWNGQLSVNELRALFQRLDPGVRVVMLMSQCFSGSFAAADGPAASDLPPGNVCGYFATAADRLAYGCYPENRGKDAVGHSYEFFQALTALGDFTEAERRVLVTDDTPDVPHTTSDVFLQQRLREAAKAQGRDLSALADDLLREAWQDRAAWEPEIRLLDRIGHTFGTFSPRSLSELDEQAKTLPDFSKRLATYAGRWEEALEALKQENLTRFIDAHPQWRTRLGLEQLNKLDAAERRKTAKELLADLVAFTNADAERLARLNSLKQRADEAAAAFYRAEVRLGVVLRMRTLLTDVAGRVYMAHHARPDERQAFERLVACEDLRVNPHPAVALAADLPTPKPFPPLAEERRLVEAVMPAWMGIQYRPIAQLGRKPPQVPDGAVAVMTVFPDSPAKTAGLRVGDVILGPPHKPFAEPHQIREWTMRSEIGVPEPLDILRGKRPLEITLSPGPYPLQLPALPGPPQVGSLAPPLKVDLLRGATRLAAGRPRLLFFWATWCKICHSALPEVLAFSAERGVQVVAITDEDPDTVRRFLDDFHDPFPSIVATDPLRLTFQRYGVSGTPTFVYVDGEGKVAHYQVGYNAKVGLDIDGWKWDQESKKVSRTE
jgi:thiol-disulfide isomerase/thioredoxin